MSDAYKPTASEVRAIRPFKLTDEQLGSYIDLAESSPFAVQAATAIPDTARKTMWALLAAHLATVMAEPEADSVKAGPLTVDWVRSMTADSLTHSAPGKEFKLRWERYNKGRVLR